MANDLFALLIGVDCYLPNQLPGGIYYGSLAGCVRDVQHVDEFLRRRLGLSNEQIFKLTASNADGKHPLEPKEAWPTYENMVAKFKELTGLASRGSQVYIHYSGHGGRATTAFPGLKGAQGLDETLVPTDIGYSEARYLRDVELAHLLKAMVDKGLLVTVVLDSCHSGGATRGLGGAVARGIGVVDTTSRPTASLVAGPAELAGTWREAAAATRDAKLGSGWLLEPRDYTLLAACRASETAYEYPFDGRERNGALTYWLLDSLKQLGPGLTYKVLHDRILAKVHGQFEMQTPQLQGEGNRQVFGSGEVQPQYAVPLIRVDKDRLLLNVGQSQGVRKGAQFAIYPAGTLHFDAIEQRLALAQISELGAVDSWAEITKHLRPDPIEQGAQAVLLDPGLVRLRRPVQFTRRDDVPATVDQDGALALIRQALANAGSGFAPVAEEGQSSTFQVTVNSREEYEIWDAAGTAIRNLRPALRISDPKARAQIVRRLVHLAKYRNVLELDNTDPMSPLARKLVVELVGKQAEYDTVDVPDPEPFDEPGRTPRLKAGEWVFVRIKNDLPKSPNTKPLNVTILNLKPRWGIEQIYPSGAGLFEPLDPGEELVIPLLTSLPPGMDSGKDMIKVFATVGTTSFRWLELPDLDEPIQPRWASRSVGDPLEELELALIKTEPGSGTRDLEVAAYPSKAWVTAQVEVEIHAH